MCTHAGEQCCACKAAQTASQGRASDSQASAMAARRHVPMSMGTCSGRQAQCVSLLLGRQVQPMASGEQAQAAHIHIARTHFGGMLLPTWPASMLSTNAASSWGSRNRMPAHSACSGEAASWRTAGAFAALGLRLFLYPHHDGWIGSAAASCFAVGRPRRLRRVQVCRVPCEVSLLSWPGPRSVGKLKLIVGSVVWASPVPLSPLFGHAGPATPAKGVLCGAGFKRVPSVP